MFWGLSVPGEVPRCSASVLALLTGFLNSDKLGLSCAKLSPASASLHVDVNKLRESQELEALDDVVFEVRR